MKLNRRDFLKGLAASSLLAPYSRALANGIPSEPPSRLAIFFSPNGTVHQHWRPTGSTYQFGFNSGSILEPLSAIQDKVIILDGINFVNATNHEGGMAAMLTGGGSGGVTGGKSLDQYVAGQLNAGTRFSSLELGVQTSPWGGSTQTRMSYSGSGTHLTPDDRPSSVFERLFGDLSGDQTEINRLRSRRLSVLDLLRDDIASLNRRLGARERLKMEAHLESFRQIELSLAESSAGGCTYPTDTGPTGTNQNENYPTVGNLQMEFLISAFACDMTRVGSVQWSHTVSPTVFTWLGHGEGHHALSHYANGNAAGVGRFVQAERWYAEQFVHFIQRLDATQDPLAEGSLLDNTVVLWCKEMGDSRLHDCNGVPFVIAGGAQSPFELGRYLQLGGVPHNKLLTSICRGMGLTNTSFGDPNVPAGTLPELI